MSVLCDTHPCSYCSKTTEWVDLSSLRAFCVNTSCRSLFLNAEICDTVTEVIHSTKDIRKMPRSMVCPITGDQRCHILGLNAAKIIFNEYGFQCQRIDDETLEQLVIAINSSDNLVCCSPEQNVKDKYTEKEFLDVFLYKKKPSSSLSKEALDMYDAMRRVFLSVQEKLGEDKSDVIDMILSDFESIASQ